jgi:hypothetical protein
MCSGIDRVVSPQDKLHDSTTTGFPLGVYQIISRYRIRKMLHTAGTEDGLSKRNKPSREHFLFENGWVVRV